ncbi:NADH-ubiquinone oxidoreductase-F iron-sulfur binding region domain-containing protein [Gaopeijia maritima]|uniref:NADH-ubiquinone oxidoreductase-F iron-sulfur binding region domain-containing protein n=1 Tax=Gaopeijia maritima TaxID=3119007 RepID=A0ABU9E7W0_9BACT
MSGNRATIRLPMAESDRHLVDRWKGEEAPLLPLLHAFHDRDGHLSEQALRAVSEGLRIPLAELYGTVTFYHHFAREPGGALEPRVCTGPVCRMRGAEAVVGALEGAVEMPCSGRCDDPIPVLRGNETFVATPAAELEPRPTPLPPPSAEGVEECVFRHIRAPHRDTLDGYRATGGYRALDRMLGSGSPDELLDLIDASGLAGRGGAGFPTGRKWRAVRDADGGPKTVVCNADEGEPGCFKDRVLMDYDPHAVIEGMLLAAFATGATRGFIYLRYEYPETADVLAHALDEARGAGYLGRGVDIHLRRGAGAYICGEETSLLNSLEGEHPFPRNRPPYPVTHGYLQTPTVVNNVETLASIPPIVTEGAAWYRGLGFGDQAGTKVVSLSGDVERPGNYEVPLGLPLATLLHDWAGGGRGGRRIQAVTMAGLSGGFLAGDDLDVTLDEPSIRAKKSFLGAGGVMVFDESRDMVEVALDAMRFFAHESCGKCFPCRIGTRRLVERLSGEAGPREVESWIDELSDLHRTMKSTSACGLGQAAPLVTESLIRYFPERVRTLVEARR